MTRKEGMVLRRAGIFLALSCLLLVGTVAPAIGATKRVRATDDNTWSPKTKEIIKNDKIRWTNPTDDEHNVRAYGGNWSFNSGDIAPGDYVEKKFRSRGTYKYFCTDHADVLNGQCFGSMCGKIRVLRPPS